MRVLILEDKCVRMSVFEFLLSGDHITHVFTSKEAIEQLKYKDWEILFLDHDLGGKENVASGENTGWEVADWLKNNPDRKPETIIIHSLNASGQNSMKLCLPEAEIIPFTKLRETCILNSKQNGEIGIN